MYSPILGWMKGNMKHPIVETALALLACDIRETDTLANPNAVRDYFRLKLGDRPHEVFAVALVDVRVLNHLIVARSEVLSFAEEGVL